MYDLVLLLHSWLRWAVLIAGFAAVLMAVLNRPQVERWGLVFMATLDLQMLLGLLMYFVVSPNMSAIRADFGAAMREPAARFWAVEHISLMFVAVILAHVGRVLARKAANPGARRMRLLVCFTLALIAILASTPWPGMAAGRPLFRF